MDCSPAQPVAQAPAPPPAVMLAESEGDVLLDGTGQPSAGAAPLAVGAAIETRAGIATLVFASGARANVARSTRVAIDAAGPERHEALSLTRGEVDVEVPKLAQPVEFSVGTPDARVVVHGTRFTVRVDPDARSGPLTRVAVTRGLVSVQSGGEQTWLRAGEQWPAPAAPAEAPVLEPAPSRAAPASEERQIEQTLRRAARVSAQRARAPRHSLAAENRVFAAAMAKHKAGDLSGALQDIERLIHQYPDTLLLQEARVERFRLLRRLGRRSEASREARSYLGDYHDGYARDEARSVALEAP